MTRLPLALRPGMLLPAVVAVLLLAGGDFKARAQQGNKPAALVAPESGKSGGASPQKSAAGKAPEKSAPPKQKTSSKPAQDPAAKSLDDELLGELSDGLFGPVEDELFRQGVQKTKSPSPSAKDKTGPDRSGTQAGGRKASSPDQLPELDQPEGEDIGPQDNPLASISRQMQQVQRKLASRQLDEQTLQMQREIVRRLEKLLEQARRKSSSSSRGGASRQQTASRSSASQQQQPRPSGARPAGNKPQGQQAAQRPNPRAEQTREKGPKTPKPEEKERNLVQDLIKRIWGHLPPRMRQQMLQSATDRFLPQYQLEIEEYFKRVSGARPPKP